MLIISKVYNEFVDKISTVYGKREANNIARIVFEDEFSIYNFSSESLVSEVEFRRLEAISQRLLKNEPIQYILGIADFYGLKFKVDPNVLIPRPETEELVYWVFETLKIDGKKEEEIKILDIGTGSGCIPITLKHKLSQAHITGLDISEGALDIAAINAGLNKVKVSFRNIDILDSREWDKLGKYELIISNPPYIPLSEQDLMSDRVTSFEPREALFVKDDDPLQFYRKISEFANFFLKKGGYLFFECNEFNAQEVLGLLKETGFNDPVLRKDMSGKDRMIRVSSD